MTRLADQAVAPPLLDLDPLLDTAQVLVCCGSGGVGKTTTAAALALRAAERGRRTVVLTIDPAKRLAQSLGLVELDNTPRPVQGIDTTAGGSLDAMMLDMKRTFDEVVLAHTTPDKAEQIFANPFYQALSSSFAGTQEYMAMEKLGQLKASDDYDLIVVDTPPTRSALDFLDAPQHLTTFLDGRLLKILLAPAKASGKAYFKVVGAGFMLFTRTVTKVIGAQALADLSTFVAALETMFGGFAERAEGTYRMLGQPGTEFVVVASPEPDAIREASFFVDRLTTEGMPLAGLVVNRVQHSAAAELSVERSLAGAQVLRARSQEVPVDGGDPALAAAVLSVHADRLAQAQRQRRIRDRFVVAHPEVGLVEVPALPGDVHDLAGLREVGGYLAGAA